MPRVRSTRAGHELGYQERTTADTTTNTVLANASSNKISSLSVTFVGDGNPVMVEYYCPQASHTVANYAAVAVLIVNGSATGGQLGVGPYSTVAPTLILRRRLTTVVGTSYTVEIGKYVATAGTGTFGAGTDSPMFLRVTR